MTGLTYDNSGNLLATGGSTTTVAETEEDRTSVVVTPRWRWTRRPRITLLPTTIPGYAASGTPVTFSTDGA